MEAEEFYGKVAEMLGVPHQFRPLGPTHFVDRDGQTRYRMKRTGRWFGRDPGNGRFPGRGLVRMFGRNVLVALVDPRLHGSYRSPEEALEAISQAIQKKASSMAGEGSIDLISPASSSSAGPAS